MNLKVKGGTNVWFCIVIILIQVMKNVESLTVISVEY